MLALAIQGIGGMNAFAAGVLQEFRNQGIEPDLISATSGSILSAYYYLDPDPQAIQNYYESVGAKEVNSLPEDIQFFQNLFFGIPGKFRPASPMDRFVENYPFFEPKSWVNFLFPAKLYDSAFPDEFYQKLADRFMTSNVGVITNSYHYEKDKAILYLNPSAFVKTGLQPGENENYIIKEMSPEGLRNSLQLLQFGERKGEYDGAYQLNPVIDPLSIADRIVVITVESIEKSIHKIENYFDSQDFLLKMLFKNALYAEINNIRLINKLIEKGIITGDKYHPIDLEIIQPSTYRGYFNYFIEDYPFFQNGLSQGKDFFARVSF